ncbi:MAG: AAA family ATPase [Bryobacteraceae bacterium]|jgi:predicted ATPase
MTNSPFLTRVVLKNYKSIEACDVDLHSLTFLVGANGAGKSNFLDALRFVADALRTSLDHALRERGGIQEVRRRTGGHPTHFGIRLEFAVPGGPTGSYAFRIGAKASGAFEVQHEECVLSGTEPLSGDIRFSVPGAAPASDRLYLPDAAADFRPVCEALGRMGFYNPNSDRIKDLQLPDAGELLARDGSNIASVLDRMAKRQPEARSRIEEYLSKIVPGVRGVEVSHVGPRETLEFRQDVPDPENPWRFLAGSMSDGTLRALATLVALFQSASVPLTALEEPAASLHPAATGVLLDALLEASALRQVLVTSHNADLLDSPKVKTANVLAVLAENGNTRIGPLDAVGSEALEQQLHTAGELLRMDQARPDTEVSTRQLRLFDEGGV